MKKLFFIMALTAASVAGYSQNSNVKFGVGLEAAFPLGNFGDAYSFGIGGSAQANFVLDPTLDLTLQAGYISFQGKTVNGYKSPTIGYVPVLGGIEYKFTPQVFGSAQLGATFLTGNGASGTAFTYSPGIGYKFTDNFNVLLKYTGYSEKNSDNTGTIGLRLGYTF
jgi:hypothetical protein